MLLTYGRVLKGIGHEKNKQNIEKPKTNDGSPLLRTVDIEIFVGELQNRRDAKCVDDNGRE